MLYLYWIIWCAAWCVVLATHIALRDRDFVGEDSVLAAELAKRLARIRPTPEELSEPTPIPPLNAGGSSPPVGEQANPPSPPSDPGYRRFLNPDPYWDLNREEVKDAVAGEGHEGGYKEFKKDWDSTNLYAMQLKVAEHAIYATQQRLTDMKRVIARYMNSPYMRMAFMLRRLDSWLIEMRDFLDYSHRNYKDTLQTAIFGLKPNSGDNPWYFANIRHIMYYQAMLRRYIDIIYTIEFLRKLHRKSMQSTRVFSSNGTATNNAFDKMAGAFNKKDQQSAPPN